jgi:hypothetical protein
MIDLEVIAEDTAAYILNLPETWKEECERNEENVKSIVLDLVEYDLDPEKHSFIQISYCLSRAIAKINETNPAWEFAVITDLDNYRILVTWDQFITELELCEQWKRIDPHVSCTLQIKHTDGRTFLYMPKITDGNVEWFSPTGIKMNVECFVSDVLEDLYFTHEHN